MSLRAGGVGSGPGVVSRANGVTRPPFTRSPAFPSVRVIARATVATLPAFSPATEMRPSFVGDGVLRRQPAAVRSCP